MKIQSLVDLVLSGGERVDSAKTAINCGQFGVSFQDLVKGAQAIAATLIKAGIKRGDRVALWMDKSIGCVQSMLGIMWAGAAYVPLDPRAPWLRCRKVLLDCDVAAVVLDRPRLNHAADIAQGNDLRLLLVEGDASLPSELAAGGTTCLSLANAITQGGGEEPRAQLDDLAYILYTSGSTGTPKGVAHTHRSGLAFVEWVQRTFEIVPDDVFSSHAPFHFDLSVSDLYASLGTGARVQLISSTEGMLPPYLVKKVAEWGITVWYSTPSILSAMLEMGELESRGFGRVRLIFFAGEVFPMPQLMRLRHALPEIGLYNLFGPTETNVCTYYEVPRGGELAPRSALPIGRACDHLETFVIDDEGREAGVGVEGILWAKGDNLMAGYWNDLPRTAELLMPDPRGRPGIACRTGDRVRLRPDGNYDFLGRQDFMVKTRGYRVELGETESVLMSYASVLEAVVVPLPDDKLGNRLVATVVPRSGHSIDAKLLRAHCGQYLPAYMIPEKLEVRAAIPRTSTGKADRAALRAEWERMENQ